MLVAELPIMPVKTDALLADTNNMSPEAFGAYCRLLFAMWRHGGFISDNPAELAQIAGMPVQRWNKISEIVMRPMKVAGGKVSQKRLLDTWEQVQVVRTKRAGAAETRWKSKRHANALHMQSTSNANQNQISKEPSSSEASQSESKELDGSLATALPTGALRSPSRGAPIQCSDSLKRSLAAKGVIPDDGLSIPALLRRTQ